MLRRITPYFLIFILTVSLLIIGGCTKNSTPAPKPIEKSPEVKKYNKEPTITLYRSQTGIKEEIKLEEYLKGVVAAEIGDEFPLEALKAQAIIARTMTLALIEYENGTRGKHGTDASDDHTEFQAYNRENISDNIKKAVDETRGQVLTTNKGNFVYAFFHSVSDKKTASINEGFPNLAKQAPYIVPVDTNGIKKAPEKYRNWTVKVPRSEIKKIMGEKAGSLDDIKISKKGPSKRALTIQAGKATIPAIDLRQEIGFDRLYSTKITSLKAEGENIVFKGKGWGHGCGLEQWGAYVLATEQNFSAKEIVEHYFPQAQWTKLYD